MVLHVQTPAPNDVSTPIGDNLSTLVGETLQRSLRLTALLQTSLDLETVLGEFHEFVRGFIDHDSASYHFEEMGVTLQFGKTARHQCHYTLTLSGEALGEFTLSHHHRFTPCELEIFENLLCALLYPLRNALLYRQAREAALIDPLTGAHNRASLDTTLAHEIELAQRHDTPLSLIAVDIDYFKQVNDRYGHITGDQALKTVVTRIRSCIRSCDALYRFGGEEFALILNNTDMEGAKLLAERIRQSVAQHPFQAGDESFALTISLGVARLRQGQNAMTLFQEADAALYRAKDSGRNRVVCNQKISSAGDPATEATRTLLSPVSASTERDPTPQG